MTAKIRLLSGMQPSGALHIGNYMGALKNWISLSERYECLFCIVDYHAITIPYNIGEMQNRIFEAAVDYLAGGIDPKLCDIFVQSDVPEHLELAWIFNAITPLGQLMRMTQFKQKAHQYASRQFVDSAQDNDPETATDDLSDLSALISTADVGASSGKAGDALQIPLEGIGRINAGLLTYPVLQAADILLYKAAVVPVGEDQVQHIELTRDIARRFNHRFGELFPLCAPLLSEAPRVMGLDAINKMSKSLGNHIPLSITPDQLVHLVTRQSVSDPRRIRRLDPGVPEDCNIYAWHKLFSPADVQEWSHSGCTSAGIGCFECKKKLAGYINDLLEPIRERRQYILKHPDYVRDVLSAGAEKARSIAQQTMSEVRIALGLRPHNWLKTSDPQ